MRRALPPVLALAVAFMWMGCDTEQPTAPTSLEPSFMIDDGSVNDVLHGFYWLPPLVSQPAFDGTFMGSLPVEVQVIPVKKVMDGSHVGFHLEWIGDPVRVFPSAEVEVDTNGQHYQVNWDTGDIDKSGIPSEALPGVYRISVTLNTKLLGFVDVEIVENGAGFKNLTSDGSTVVGLIDGRTLPIKFRIENEMFDMVFQAPGDHPGESCGPVNDLDVFLGNSKTHTVFNLTNSPCITDGTPNWSPDGKKIVFASNREGGNDHLDLYTMDPDGTNVEPLAADGWQPEYSPNGSMIAFQRGSLIGTQQNIWVMNADGTGQLQLTDINNGGWGQDPFEDWGPTWHPDGNLVTFARSHNSFIDYDEDGTTVPHTALTDDCDMVPPYTHQQLLDLSQSLWEDPGCFWHFDIVSIDISDSEHPWTRHTYMLDKHLEYYPDDNYPDLRTPRWAPDGGLAFETGALLAIKPPPVTYGEWADRFTPGVFDYYTNLAVDSQNPSWSLNGEVIFRSDGLGGDGPGIYYVNDWGDWVAHSTTAQRLAFVNVGFPGLLSWPRFRPN